MIVKTLDGPSKVGKTCIGEGFVEAFGSDRQVRLEVAGDFFRTITAAAIEKLGTCEAVPLDQLEDVVGGVFSAGVLEDSDRHWGDLQSPAICGLVSTVGQLESVQHAAEDWYTEITERAYGQGVDLLVVDGRNPRDRMTDVLEARSVQVSLDLLVECDVAVAAERMLRGQGVTLPTAEELVKARANIARRRQQDASRKSNPYTEPHNVLDYDWESGEGVPNIDYARQLVSESYRVPDGGGNAPCAIRFDTTHMPKDVMLAHAIGLAEAAENLLLQ